MNNHGKLFQCKPFPYSGWCNNSPAYYEPGAGLAWADADGSVKQTATERLPFYICTFLTLTLSPCTVRGHGRQVFGDMVNTFNILYPW